VLVGLLLAVSLRAAHELVGAGVLPSLVRDLGGESWAGAFFAVYGLAAAAGILVAGRATDRRGPAGPLAFGLATFGAGMVATGLAPSMPAVVAARAAEGFGGGMVSVVVSAAVIRAYDAAQRPRVLAWLSAAWVIPGLVAPALAVGVAQRFGWRAVFLGLAPLVALAAALAVPAVRGRGASAPREARAALRAARATAPARGPLAAALAVRALAVFAFFGVEAFLPLSLSALRGAGGAQVAALLTLSALAWTAGAFLQARLCERWSPPVLARAGVLALVVGIGCAILSLSAPTPPGVVLGGWTLAGLGMGVVYNTATASAMLATGAGGEGTTGAALGIVDAVASSVATAVVGVFVAATSLTAPSAVFAVAAAFLLAAAVGAAALVPAGRLEPYPRRPRSAATATSAPFPMKSRKWGFGNS
jgi:MFS family permease